MLGVVCQRTSRLGGGGGGGGVPAAADAASTSTVPGPGVGQAEEAGPAVKSLLDEVLDLPHEEPGPALHGQQGEDKVSSMLGTSLPILPGNDNLASLCSKVVADL